MTGRIPIWLLSTAILSATLAACTYDPPPDVRLIAPAQNRFVQGDPIVLAFSEPVATASIEVRVWPGNKDLYDIEGEQVPGVAELLPTCTVASSPCPPGGVTVSVSADRLRASIDVPPQALGEPGLPLVLEVGGRLSDDAGREKKVARFFDFQIVRQEEPPAGDVLGDAADASAGDVPALDREVAEGPHFFFAQFTSPIEIAQQFFCDVEVDPVSGDFLMILTDGDPLDSAPRNTADPKECLLDTGDEGFVFTAWGRLFQASPGADPSFEAEPFTLGQSIGPIYFELRDMKMHGTVRTLDGRASWDGTMSVSAVYYKVGDIEQVYPADQANFQIRQLTDDEVPAGMPRVCDKAPCEAVGGKCDLPPGVDWPDVRFCGID